MRLLSRVLGWFQGLSWYRVFSPGDVRDISWIELYWEFVSCTGLLPPFLVDGQWVSVSDNEDAVCCVPPAAVLFRTWKRAVDFLGRRGVLVPGEVCRDTASARALGAKFSCSGVSWRVAVAERVRCELTFQFSVCSSLSSVRLPPFS